MTVSACTPQNKTSAESGRFVEAGVQVQGKPTPFLMELWRLASVRSTGVWLCMGTWVRTWARSQAEHVETRVSPWLLATTWLSPVACHRLGSQGRSPLQTPRQSGGASKKFKGGPKDQGKASDSHGRDGDGDDTGTR